MIKSKLVDLILALVSICRLDRAEDSKYRQNFLIFGVGPHKCVGREYASLLCSYSQSGSRRLTFPNTPTPLCERYATLVL